MNRAQFYVAEHLRALEHFKSSGTKIFGDPTPVYEFLMEHGKEFNGQDKPERYVWRAERMCFQNAYTLALKSNRLTYVEGFAMCGLLPVHHAWCIDPEGGVVDPTWRPYPEREIPSSWDYFGVPIDVRKLRTWWDGKFTSSCLYDFTYHRNELAPGLTVDEIVVKVEA